jgi:hypothetical protein
MAATRASGLEVVGVVAREPTPGRLQMAYRIIHHDVVVFARSDLSLPASAVVSGDTTIRLARDHALTRPDTSPDERAWLAAHGDELTARTEPPPAPFPPGTPIVVDAGGYRGPTTGQVIRASLDAAGRIVGYYWRPDAYNHVGHRYRRESYRWLLSAAGDVRPTLQAPDPGPADLVGYGAQVRAIDHPDLLTGTVLRLLRGRGQTMMCEVQPDHPASSPITLAAADLQIIGGHGWLTIADLTAARDEAGHPLAAGEIMVTVRERALVVGSPSGPIVRRVQAAPRRPDPLLDPDAHQPEARFLDPLRPPLPPLGPAPGTPEFPGP